MVPESLLLTLWNHLWSQNAPFTARFLSIVGLNRNRKSSNPESYPLAVKIS